LAVVIYRIMYSDCFVLPWTSFEYKDSTGSPRKNGDLGEGALLPWTSFEYEDSIGSPHKNGSLKASECWQMPSFYDHKLQHRFVNLMHNSVRIAY